MCVSDGPGAAAANTKLEAVLGSGMMHCVGARKGVLIVAPGISCALGQKELGQTQPCWDQGVGGWLLIHHIISLLGAHQGGFCQSPGASLLPQILCLPIMWCEPMASKAPNPAPQKQWEARAAQTSSQLSRGFWWKREKYQANNLLFLLFRIM